MRRSRARIAVALAVLRAHPRHLVLAGLVAGLLAGPAPETERLALVAGAAIAVAAVAGRAPLALLAAAAVVLGAGVAHARLDAIDRTALRPHLGKQAALRVTLLERFRTSASGARSALARVEAGPGRGERIVVRLPRRGAGSPAAPRSTTEATGSAGRAAAAAPGAVLRARGRLVGLREWDAHQRRKGAHAVLLTSGSRRPARGGAVSPGGSTACGTRAEEALSAGLPAREAALFRGMVLGQDEALSESLRDEFRASGLAHLLRRYHSAITRVKAREGHKEAACASRTSRTGRHRGPALRADRRGGHRGLELRGSRRHDHQPRPRRHERRRPVSDHARAIAMKLDSYIRVSRVGWHAEGDRHSSSPDVQREQIQAYKAKARGHRGSTASGSGPRPIGRRDGPARVQPGHGPCRSRPGRRHHRGQARPLRPGQDGCAGGGSSASTTSRPSSCPWAEQFDTSTPMGQAMLKIALVFAELTLDNARENWREARRRAVEERGVHISSMTPTGYTAGGSWA